MEKGEDEGRKGKEGAAIYIGAFNFRLRPPSPFSKRCAHLPSYPLPEQRTYIPIFETFLSAFLSSSKKRMLATTTAT